MTMSRSDRADLIRLAKAHGKQAELEVDTREQVLRAEVEGLITAEYEARDELWAEAVQVAEAATAQANAQIRTACADLGIPPKFAPSLHNYFVRRSGELADKNRRAELRKLADERLKALTKTAKTVISERVLKVETALVSGGLETDEAKAFLETQDELAALLDHLRPGHRVYGRLPGMQPPHAQGRPVPRRQRRTLCRRDRGQLAERPVSLRRRP